MQPGPKYHATIPEAPESKGCQARVSFFLFFVMFAEADPDRPDPKGSTHIYSFPSVS